MMKARTADLVSELSRGSIASGRRAVSIAFRGLANRGDLNMHTAQIATLAVLTSVSDGGKPVRISRGGCPSRAR